MTVHEDDMRHMRHALRLAARALGVAAPNPAVGCVLVAPDGTVVGRGTTGTGGRPHAETEALKQAGSRARGATAYVTLEPCAHHGQTPPCADALAAAGITRVVCPLTDPDPRVSGVGFAKLETADVAVERGVGEAEARALNAGFLKRNASGRPLVTLKIAQTADGFVADGSGKSRWITGERARRHGHLLRARHDAVMIGSGTAEADDPLLTCRLPGLEDRSPVRVVLDTDLSLSPRSQLARSARKTPVMVITAAEADGAALTDLGVEILRVHADEEGRPSLTAALAALGARGLTRLLVEGGPILHTAFLSQRLADFVELYRAPVVLGAGARSAFDSLASDLADAPHLTPLGRADLSPDLLESFAVPV